MSSRPPLPRIALVAKPANTSARTMLTNTVSTRLDLLRFPAILGVLFIHSATTSMHTAEGTLGASHSSASVELIKYCIAKGVAAPAVPLLFMMSGFLFFQGFQFSWKNYGEKLRRRVSTLLVPFILWNCLSLSAYAIGESLPATRSYFLGNPQWPLIGSFDWLDYLRAFGLGSLYPIAYHFWYVRDLMAMVLLVPILAAILNSRAASWALALLGLLWVAGWWPLFWPSAGVLLFFCCGAYLSLKKIDLCLFDGTRGWLLLALSLALLVLDVASRPLVVHEPIHKLLIIVAVLNAWWISSMVVRSRITTVALLSLGSASFFVFAAHEPLLMIVRRMSLRILERHSDAAVLAYFLLMPFLLSAFLVLVYRALSLCAPSVLRVMTGDRRAKYGKDLRPMPTAVSVKL